mmetsp:Transcript_62671/g.53161  ORF Transcript_62671/g.53161 Transcript_62671/m.53161 type:complete len:119 (+) Transcript_62671:913-1269(+)
MIWSDKHVSSSFETTVKLIYNNMRAGFSQLQKHNFTNWFVTKTGGIKGKEQNRLKGSMSELFLHFDNDNSKSIEFEEFRRSFWWIEIFFEGYYQFRYMDKDNNSTISINEFKMKLPDL